MNSAGPLSIREINAFPFFSLLLDGGGEKKKRKKDSLESIALSIIPIVTFVNSTLRKRTQRPVRRLGNIGKSYQTILNKNTNKNYIVK